MPFKDISYLELWRPFCSVEQNHLCNFDRRHQEEQFCEIILNLDQGFKRRCYLKIFLIWSSCGPFVQRSGTICAILVEGIMRNNSLNLFWIWASASQMWFKRFLIWSSVEWNHLCNFERGHHGEHSYEVIWNLDQWFRRRCHLKKKATDRRTTNEDRSQYLILSLRLRWAKKRGDNNILQYMQNTL